jgi:hypothetical protein
LSNPNADPNIDGNADVNSYRIRDGNLDGDSNAFADVRSAGGGFR